MTLRLTLGIDPGQSGAIAAVADGEFDRFIDMPTMPRAAGGMQVNGTLLAAELRGLMHAHRGAAVSVVLEQVSAMPKQGSSSTFRFGQADGIVRGVIGALALPLVEVHSSVWKRYMKLHGLPKDQALTAAIQRFPAAAMHLTRKKDCGRADALLIAAWAQATEALPRAA